MKLFTGERMVCAPLVGYPSSRVARLDPAAVEENAAFGRVNTSGKARLVGPVGGAARS